MKKFKLKLYIFIVNKKLMPFVKSYILIINNVLYCSIMECGKSAMNYVSEISQVIPDLNKETSVAYLQKNWKFSEQAIKGIEI